jgi:hypothetical protein
MPRNEEGEFELVLGNRQLLSGFFIVVVLFGVFFTMGYIVGRHSTPPTPSTSAAAGVEPAPSQAPSPVSPEPGRAAVVPVDEKKGEKNPADTPPSTVGTRPATAPAEAPRRVEPSKAEGGLPEPAPGIYLQVAAPRRTAAEGVLESLKNKGTTAVLAPGPNEDTVRVLVGPLDKANVGKVRLELEGAGFKPFVKNY